MKQPHQPFMSPSPWGISSRRSGSVQNVYRDWNFYEDAVEYPYTSKLMTESGHPEWYEHLWHMSAGDKTEMSNEWTITRNAGVYGGVICQMSTAGSNLGFGLVRDGRYVPNFVAGGYTTNNDDWSVKYDAIRGHFYDMWKDDYPSDSHRWTFGCRPTAGSANHGTLSFEISRNFTNRWRVQLMDGNGNTTDTYLGGSAPDQADDSCHLQFEFVKGSHVTLKLIQIQNGAFNWSTFTTPTWPIVESGYYVKIALTGSGLNQLTPITPYFTDGSSFEYSNGYIGRLRYELRGIGNDWETLV